MAVVSSFDSLVPMIPIFAAVTAQEIGFYALMVGVLIFPNWLAARLLAPNPTMLQVLGAIVLQVFLLIGYFVLMVFGGVLAGSGGIILASLVAVVIASAAIGGIFRFGAARGFAYMVLVHVISLGLGIALEFAVGNGGDVMARFRKAFEKTGSTEQPVESGPNDAGEPRKDLSLVQQFSSVSEAQQAAIARYPDLGKAGTPFNQRFLERHNAYKAKNDPLLSTPGWPMHIAEEVAKDLGIR